MGLLAWPSVVKEPALQFSPVSHPPADGSLKPSGSESLNRPEFSVPQWNLGDSVVSFFPGYSHHREMGSHRDTEKNFQIGVPYGSRTRVAAVKEKRPMVIQRNLAAWIALYRTSRTHGNAYWTLSGLAARTSCQNQTRVADIRIIVAGRLCE